MLKRALLITAVLLALDQASKFWAARTFRLQSCNCKEERCVHSLWAERAFKLYNSGALIVKPHDTRPHNRQIVPGFFDVCHVLNNGASWGIFAGWRWLLTAFACAALALLVVFRKHVIPENQPLPAATLALLLGGIAGNLVDRVHIGGVVDFLHVHWRYRWNFPVFNVADACITFGLVFYVIGVVITERNAKRAARETGGDAP